MKTIKFDGKEYAVRIGAYPASKLAMFVELRELPDDGSNRTVITVNLGNFYCPGSFVQFGSSFIDVNRHCGFNILQFLKETGLAVPYVKWGEEMTKCSGWVEYPLYEFNRSMLEELDPSGFKSYMETWMEGCEEEQSRMNDDPCGYGW